jgi:nucleoside transporter
VRRSDLEIALTPRYVRTRLSAMMLLFYLGLGAWAVTSSTYLKSSPDHGGLCFSNSQVGWIYSTFAIGGILANPFVGLLADRLFRAERVFGIACLFCGGFLLASAWWCERSEPFVAAAFETGDSVVLEQTVSGVFGPLFGLMLAQSFCLQIALPLCTVLSMRNLSDPHHQFSRIRMWGTVGWIVVGLVMGAILAPVSSQPLLLAGIVALITGLYGFTLPRTPPKGGGKTLGEAFGWPAMRLFRGRSFAVFIGVAFVLSVMNQFYGVHGHRFLTERGIPQPERWMVIGQVVEVLCMFVIPLLNPKRNMKWLMLAGALGGAIRGPALAWGPDWLVFTLGVPMHGVHFAFYFIVAATFIDREAPPHLRASAQAISSFVSGGLGPLGGNLLASWVLDHNQFDGQVDWTPFWMWSFVCCLLAAMAFLIGFRTPDAVSPVAVPSSQVPRKAADPEPDQVLGG